MIKIANYDKYDPKAGGFRAPLAADWLTGDLKKVIGVGLDANGRVVKGAGTSGFIGVLVLTQALLAGDIVDVMTNGEIVDFTPSTAGTVYYAATADGVVNATSAAGKLIVGHTVQANRLVVRTGVGRTVAA